MRLTTVAMYSSKYAECLDFSMREQDQTSRYVVRAMTGIDAEELVPKFYGFGKKSGLRFYEFEMKPRDIVIRVALNPNFYTNESYSDIRDEVYRAISASRDGRVMLHFRAGATTVARIPGMITKFEVPHFSQLPEIQLTITCNDPIFRALNPVKYDPFELNALPLTEPIVISDASSTAPHGFCFEMKCKTALNGVFRIQDADTSPDWVFQISQPSGGWLVDDEIYFSSEFSNKYVYYVRGGVTTHLMDRLNVDVVWPTIFPGANELYFKDRNRFDFEELHYSSAYWGV